MKRRYNRLLCVIITLFILASGMCLEIPRADSFFGCINNGFTTSYITSSKGMLSRYEISSRETIGIRDTAFISSISRKTDLRTTLRGAWVLSLVEVCLLKLSNLQMVTEIACASETHFFTTLLNYLHNQDGKK